MLKSLSFKFSAAAISALFIIELIMILLINGINYHETLTQTDEALSQIISNGGRLPAHDMMDDMPFDMIPPDDFGQKAPFRHDDRADKEIRYTIRYFTAAADADGEIFQVDTGHIATVSSEMAQEYAQQVLSSGGEHGFFGGFGFRYGVKTGSDGSKLIVFCDFSTAAANFVRVMKLSALIAVGLLIVFSLMIVLVSKRVVKPVIENSEKQARFITDAGHELKTPLAIIRANTEVIEMTEGESEWTRSTIAQTDRLNDLLSRMLTLAKSQESQRFSFENADMTALCEKLAANFDTYCSAADKPLKSEIAQQVEVCGDVKMLDMLISTLLENAVKYGTEGEGINFTLESGSKYAIISVQNHCSDPPTGDLDLLFDRFYRGDSSRTRENGGSGIGLSIAKTITDAHKAKISCAVSGDLVTFTVKIKHI